MYGCIGNCIDPVFTLGKRTESNGFIDFLFEVIDEWERKNPYSKQRPYLLLDNHSVSVQIQLTASHQVHLAYRVKPYLEQYFKVLFMPAYSSFFNP